MNLNLQRIYKGNLYSFNFKLGLLIKKPIKETKNKKKNNKIDDKILKNLNLIRNPFLLGKVPELNLKIEYKKFIKIYAELLIWLSKHCYFGLYLISHIRLNYFNNAVEAIDFFISIHPKNQKKLCLPRAVFGATTSKEFNKSGILVIGIFHPTKHMHSWIIENQISCDRYDNIWTNYTPLYIIS